MENHWASENLQTIRTLMERSAIYRRALAPIMIVTGFIGWIASVISKFAIIETNFAFAIFWITTSVVAFVTAMLLVRRQALQESEPFWSLPTQRVWGALLPNFFAGLAAGFLFIVPGLIPAEMSWILPPIWMLFYGCGLYAAGFFMQRSIKRFGWIFIFGGLALLFWVLSDEWLRSTAIAHQMMGLFFGAIHLAFGIYLFFTERKKNEA
jgi:hypothetical protein